MRLEYISHSCFAIISGNTKLAFDPWISGSAYSNQWHLFPKAVDTSLVETANAILISHGHEDHLHHESLKSISKDAHVFFPYQWRKGIVGYLNHLGFSKITEAVSFTNYFIDDIKITYVGYALESVIVVECEGKVIVNINDALNSNHETAVEYLLSKIKSNWPKIDYLLSGWSGAGYFPNKVHYKSKDDVVVGKIREQYFANNFCRFIQYLNPEIAIPFAPGFVLLQNENRWINEIKFPRHSLESYYRENFDKATNIQFPIMYPGDYFSDKHFYKTSKYYSEKDEKELYENIDEIFADEIIKANECNYFQSEDLEKLIRKLELRINKNSNLYHSNVIHETSFSIRLLDIKENNFLNIGWNGKNITVKKNSCALPDNKLIITTKAGLISQNLEKEWGGDLLTIGYGIDIEVFDEFSLEKNLDIVYVRLISRYPTFKDDFLRHSGRIAKYYLLNPSLTNLWINQKIKLKPYVNKYPFNERDHWITYKKCDLCKVCNLPDMAL